MHNLNVLILAGGKTTASLQTVTEQYPDYLTEHNGVPLVEYLVRQCDELEPHKIICLFSECEIRRYHLRNMIEQISPVGSVVSVQGQTAGAACTALLACEEIDNSSPLLIMGSNEFLSIPLKPALDHFLKSNADAGVFTFKSVHPRYAFVRLGENSQVIEASEKNPISSNAIAGMFWFRRGADFVVAVKNMVRKDVKVNDGFYIAPALNEFILRGKKINAYGVASGQYYSLRSAAQLYAFETETAP